MRDANFRNAWGPGGQSYDEKLKSVGLKSLLYRRDRADLITIFRWIKDKVNVNEYFDFYADTIRATRVADYP